MSEAPPIRSPASKDATSLTECSTVIFTIEKDPYLSGPVQTGVVQGLAVQCFRLMYFPLDSFQVFPKSITFMGWECVTRDCGVTSCIIMEICLRTTTIVQMLRWEYFLYRIALFSKQNWLGLANGLIILGVFVYTSVHMWWALCLYINACIYTIWKSLSGLFLFLIWSLKYFKTQEVKHCVYYRQNYPWVYGSLVCGKDSWVLY